MACRKSTTMSLDGAFDSIPVMYVEPLLSIDRLLDQLLSSDIADASTPERRATLAREIRNACMNVGFFYSEHHTLSTVF